MVRPFAARRLQAAALLSLAIASHGRAQGTQAPETLADAWQIALAVDWRLSAARHVTESASHTLTAARAARSPTMNVEAGYTALSHAPTTIVDIPPLILPGLETPLRVPFDRLAFGPARSWSYRASASLPLFTSGRIGEHIAAADAQVSAARSDEATTELDVKLRVAEAYVGVLRATRLVEVADSEVTGLIAHATDAANLLEQGVTSKNDRLAAQVALADARQRRIQAGNALDSARAAYNRRLGRPLDHMVTLEEPLLPAIDADLAALTARAIARRPEIATLTNQAEALLHQSRTLSAVTRPQASAGAGYSYQENPYQLYPGFWSAGFSVAWTLFDGGLGDAEAAAARDAGGAAISRRDELRSVVALDVRQAWLDLDGAEQRVRVAHETIEQAEENLRVARDRYAAGVGIATEVLDAEALRTRSHTNAASAAYDRIVAMLRLRRAAGDL